MTALICLVSNVWLACPSRFILTYQSLSSPQLYTYFTFFRHDRHLPASPLVVLTCPLLLYPPLPPQLLRPPALPHHCISARPEPLAAI